MNKKIIAITGVARSGKNSLANAITKSILNYFPNRRIEQFSFAEKLKTELNAFCYDAFKISTFTEDTNEKEIIRPLLIGHGTARRLQSNNKYWIEHLENKIEKSDCDIAIITDLRFAENKEDELGWLKSKGGFNIHIKRFVRKEGTTRKIFEQPKIAQEKQNNKKLEKNAVEIIEIERKIERGDFISECDKIADKFLDSHLSLFV